jgi:hypothetical protein
MARGRSLCCFVSPTRGKPSDVKTRRSSAACICCIGPHHKSSSGVGAGLGANNADLSARSPLIGCCGNGDVRGRSATRTPTARRLCGVRSRTPRRGQQGCCFPAAGPAAAALNSARVAAPARTPRTPTTPLGQVHQRGCCVRAPAQGNAKLERRRIWFRSKRQTVAQRTPRSPGTAGRDSAPRGGNSGVKVYGARVAEVEGQVAAKEEEETCSNDEYAQLCREGFSREDVAAVTIQAIFRGHLVREHYSPPACVLRVLLENVRMPFICWQARRACKALKSLVRLQAVARGAYVRRQAEVAIDCMQAMVLLQVRVRARQMVTKPKEGQPLLQS